MTALARRLQRVTTQTLVSNSIYINPANTNVAMDGNVTVAVRINPGSAVTVVQTTINFNPAHLEYVSINTSASPFDTNVQQTVGASSITTVRAKLDPSGISTDSLIAEITFRALQSSGSSALTVSDANAAFDGNYTNPSTSGATITFTS